MRKESLERAYDMVAKGRLNRDEIRYLQALFSIELERIKKSKFLNRLKHNRKRENE